MTMNEIIVAQPHTTTSDNIAFVTDAGQSGDYRHEITAALGKKTTVGTSRRVGGGGVNNPNSLLPQAR
jgi:hypothetical protein